MTNNMRLGSCVCAVTGGASGLGEATARSVIAAGGKVAILDVDTSLGQVLAATLGANSIFIHCNVAYNKSVCAAMDAAVAKFGRIDVLVTCAGIAAPESLINCDKAVPSALFERTIQVNLVGTFYAIRHAVRHMAKQPEVGGERGVVVMVSSAHADEGTGPMLAYAASKSAISGMTLTLARELSKHRIRAVAIYPGLFSTPMGNGFDSSAILKATLIPRKGQPEEFADTVKYVVDNKFVTGCVLRLDGGLRIPHL